MVNKILSVALPLIGAVLFSAVVIGGATGPRGDWADLGGFLVVAVLAIGCWVSFLVEVRGLISRPRRSSR